MMPIIKVAVNNKVALPSNSDEFIVCGNSDYEIEFEFDAEWDGLSVKTARFIYNGKYEDIVFEGNRVAVPVVSDTVAVFVGVFSGDLRTTTPALIPCKKSILCEDGVPTDPTPDVYTQLLEILNSFDDGLDGKSAYEIAMEHGFEGSEEEWLESLHGEDGKDGADGTNGKDGYTPVKGVDYFDGKNGTNGEDGVNGKDGYTPVRGKDYWTDADKAEIKSYVDDAILGGAW